MENPRKNYRSTARIVTVVNGQDVVIAPAAQSRVRLEIYRAGSANVAFISPNRMTAVNQGIELRHDQATVWPVLVWDARDVGQSFTANEWHGFATLGNLDIIVVETFEG